ncbi:2-C-methyl-D-erythritol 4-phosphate cytidylyltransferase [Caproiciproducens galactitolivorans]|uniref:2-C-methyl-D-erythritol 4-phosphate cytidylyltransferase n=1 Tax=Caproiciproducens galactitolivorans TaxID=642589 RepID=A0A4Z0Y274_9FIRM|nr:2-C-methyl-D-erythritol 4-phosphate cytidylyltransferase [Caproiciproducens galactitolivorans]QEY34412.1 2-C-methyl-D-erythritol 4-phosphate cytidylyltransferase [Caproiciproducens galactitolivorans]TGJ77814.1 2-C-methyl-D-erythritol 4-phosphate cytidylyltransferase [Caproiciproducens galactitolivorans]
MGKDSNCCAIIVAAGESTRMALGFSKQFIPLCGVPAIVHTLFAFDAAEMVKSVIVVCRREDMPEMKDFIEKYRIKKVISIVEGGITRQKSVEAGVMAAPVDAAFFAIHDGARSLITPEEIDASIKDGIRCGASALAVPVKDTIKITGKDNYVISTPERSTLWAVQTPQVFERELYLKAMQQANKVGADYTDDCQLVEKIGVKVHLCMGTYTNLKLTTNDDIYTAEAIVKCRRTEK